MKHFENCELKQERTSWRKEKYSLNVVKAAGSRRDGEKIYRQSTVKTPDIKTSK